MKPPFDTKLVSWPLSDAAGSSDSTPALSRRHFLALLATLAAAGGVACSEDAAVSALPTDALAAFVDTLVPADEFGPSASAVGVHLTLTRKAMDEPELRQLLVNGFRWIDGQTNRGFAALNAESKNSFLQRMSEMPGDSLPRALFDQLRDHCFAAYYANSLAWRGLAIDRPPQPAGYPDYIR
ncbi:MAG: gluconate 2-dehydrogenase subunit 3 family protein [Candidatus Accumulibacter sp.]|uniref:gluconate 2-dehydrogenase subunit 3 family protein n=1 Tax=Accumulibacter sp. TaxID=2053492 RepID=UPI0028794187|nr:gluconate 2-dehydrogenase subunit 3 family protein [Accumulibacter sp.]MDS4014294.1 gluconate 2-dehydrogenase subunit 3 family protein [Accumulibacter sp.]